MKIIVTGSLGHISKPLATELLQKGHTVTIISSDPDKQSDIEAIGGIAAIGSLEDTVFLTATFTGADAVYCMVPPNYHKDKTINLVEYYGQIGANYELAIKQSGVKRVIHLSSIGANLDKDTGLILAHHGVENKLKQIPGIGITHMRPSAFYYNLYGFINSIKEDGVIISNYGGEDRVPWVSPLDIAAAIAEEIVTPFVGSKIRYVASDEPTCNEIASVLGAAIGKPNLQWIVISEEQMRARLEATGLSSQLAAGLVEMNAGIHSGMLAADYYHHRPATMGKIKIADFAREFAVTFNNA